MRLGWRYVQRPHFNYRSMSDQAYGALAYENWHAALAGVPVHGVFEYPLFTDSELVGEWVEGLGPYQILNTLADKHAYPGTPKAVLRVASHPPADLPSLENRRDQAYHGGLIHDELAALISLLLGVRLKAGAASRHFQPHGDPRGEPWAFKQWGQRDPTAPIPTERPILPRLTGVREFGDAVLLSTYPELSPQAAVALARAARLYQDAVWIAELEPELSWLMLTSAVETAASFHSQASEHPLDSFRAWQCGGAIEELLSSNGRGELVAQVAEIVVPYLGATRKFRNFLLEFLPAPPAVRPPEHLRISWEKGDLRKAFNVIYDHRSRALHGGTPFPAPMCWPPRMSGDAYAERTAGTGAGSRGAVWTIESLPMLLSVFEYIVHHALCTWWGSLVQAQSPTT